MISSLLTARIKTLKLNPNSPMPSQIKEGHATVYDRLASYPHGGHRVLLFKKK